MLTKAITYTNYNGEKRTKNFYFNLTATELAKMEIVEKAGLEETIKKMINEDDRAKILQLFDSIVLGSVGEKSADGETFIKNDKIREDFKNHPAYDVLFMELLNSDAMADFIQKVIPQNISAEMKKNPNKNLNEIMGYEVIPEENKPQIEPVK